MNDTNHKEDADMKKALTLLLALLLAATAMGVFAEESDAPAMAIEAGPVTGDFEAPALTNPEARYDFYYESTDGSEQLIFAMLDAANDEAQEIETYGALHITENVLLDDSGTAAVQAHITIQDSPYGKVMIASTSYMGIQLDSYFCGNCCCSFFNGEFEPSEGFDAEIMAYYTESYHFPYGGLETLNSVRQDENGYTYYLVKSDEDMSFEFVSGEGMRILQTRVYMRDEDGTLTLLSYADYDVGPALEIPQEVLDVFAEKLPLLDSEEETHDDTVIS